MKRIKTRRTVPAVAALTLALGLSACGAANEGTTDEGAGGLSGTLNAGGSSAQEAAVAAWKKGFQIHEPRDHRQLRPGRFGRRA